MGVHYFLSRIIVISAILAGFTMTGCASSVRSVNLKINTEPEGAHVIYRLTDLEQVGHSEWIYLGNTPYRGVRMVDESQIDDGSKISIKVMRAGYYDQLKEWNGRDFLDESEELGVIFWTPSLVPQSDRN